MFASFTEGSGPLRRTFIRIFVRWVFSCVPVPTFMSSRGITIVRSFSLPARFAASSGSSFV